MSLGEGVMDKKEVVELCMESPLYFSMPLKTRLGLVKGRDEAYSSSSLRKVLLTWIRTGYYYSSDPDTLI
jgi:hypothetical protein